MGNLAGDLARIEAAVAAGQTDLRILGFWTAVAAIKRDPALIEAHADQVGRIDTAAFRARVRPRFPVWVGNAALVGVLLGGAAAVVVASVAEGSLAGLALVAAAVAWSVGAHSPAHWVVGRVVGIRSTDYFFGGPPPPRPGLKTDYASYLRTSARARAWFHASGALATKAAPFVALGLAPLTNAPGWAVLATLGLGLVQIATDLAFSVKTSDWKKFRREMAIAHEAAARAG
ncbi:MAG: hypothetical protein WD096_08405 [Actinomycetota bacterium]